MRATAAKAVRILVDRDRCEANGVCVRLAPQVFWLDEDERLQIREAAAEDSQLRARLEQAARSCPRAALAIGATGGQERLEEEEW